MRVDSNGHDRRGKVVETVGSSREDRELGGVVKAVDEAAKVSHAKLCFICAKGASLAPLALHRLLLTYKRSSLDRMARPEE